MAKSVAYDGYGVTLGWGDGASSETFTDFAEVLSVSLPAEAVEFVDVTHASSPSKYREFISGLIDPGEVTCELNMVQADYTQLRGDLGGSERNYEITLPDDNYSTKPTVVFPAIVTGLEVEIGVEDRVTVSVTFKVTGAVVYTEGTT
jgi:hypothetical protein